MIYCCFVNPENTRGRKLVFFRLKPLHCARPQSQLKQYKWHVAVKMKVLGWVSIAQLFCEWAFVLLQYGYLRRLDCIFRTHDKDEYLNRISKINCTFTIKCPLNECHKAHWSSVNNDGGVGLVSSSNKPLSEPMLTKFHYTICRHDAIMC